MLKEFLDALDELAGEKTIDSETWKIIPIKQFNGKYEASDLGRIRNAQTGRILSPFENQGRVNKYLRVTLMYGKTPRHFYVHRLVAMAFKKGNAKLPHVHHINAETFDNTPENLSFVTREQNERAKEPTAF